MSSENAGAADMFRLNKPNSIVPPMKNVVGNTYAETKAEIEARKRAEEYARLAAQEAAAAVKKQDKAETGGKNPTWLVVLTIIFAVLGVAGASLGVVELVENDKLKTQITELEEKYKTVAGTAETFKGEFEEVKAQLWLLTEHFGLNPISDCEAGVECVDEGTIGGTVEEGTAETPAE